MWRSSIATGKSGLLLAARLPEGAVRLGTTVDRLERDGDAWSVASRPQSMPVTDMWGLGTLVYGDAQPFTTAVIFVVFGVILLSPLFVGTAIFLASEASSFVSGQIIYVDGAVLATL